MRSKPCAEDVLKPWIAIDCVCDDASICDTCDGYGWYYHNTRDNVDLSEMIRDACERHG